MLIKNDHDEPGVVPGRYAGEAIPIHDGPTPQSIADEEQRRRADGLAGRISAAAADAGPVRVSLAGVVGGIRRHEWDPVLERFQVVGALALMGVFDDSRVAREHVRVAKALRRVPRIAELFREGRLSYSKVREVTRVVDVVDETRLAQLALTAIASQPARMISGFRAADGLRIKQQPKRSLSFREREDGMIDFRARLPKEEAAVLLAAIKAAKDQFGPPPPKPDPCGDAEQESAPAVGTYSNTDALLDVARGFLGTGPEDRSGEDRTLVVVHVSAENLTTDPSDVPAGMSDVAPGTAQPSQAVSHIEGVGSVEAATAQKLACDNRLLGALIDKHGKALALGRTRRLVSKAQRRALMIRDTMCRYPGCHQTRHLKAHHVVSWIVGGRTDLDNLILLCQWHHTAVHEGGVSIAQGSEGWVFTKPDGQPCDWWVSDENLARHLDFALRRRKQAQHDQLAAVDSFQHPAAQTIRPRWAGERFDRHACVEALFTIKRPAQAKDRDQQAA